MSTFTGEKSLLSGTARPRELIVVHLYVRQLTGRSAQFVPCLVADPTTCVTNFCRTPNWFVYGVCLTHWCS